MPALLRPDVQYHASFLAAMAEFADEGRTDDDTMVGTDLARWSDTWATADGFADYIGNLGQQADPAVPPRPGRVHSTSLWWVEGQEYLGRLAIRHELTPHLLEVGGHIGYDVRRTARRRGHATAMLVAALPVAADVGIRSALLTCDADNVASRTVIERAGGVLEDQRGDKLRYWVPTAP